MARNSSDLQRYTRMPSYGVYLVVLLLLVLAFLALLIGIGFVVVRDRQSNMMVQSTVRAVYATNTAVESARQATATAKAQATSTPTATVTLRSTAIPLPTDTLAPAATLPPTLTPEITATSAG